MTRLVSLTKRIVAGAVPTWQIQALGSAYGGAVGDRAERGEAAPRSALEGIDRVNP